MDLFRSRLSKLKAKGGFRNRACRVIILDKGKPVARLGRKAKGLG